MWVVPVVVSSGLKWKPGSTAAIISEVVASSGMRGKKPNMEKDTFSPSEEPSLIVSACSSSTPNSCSFAFVSSDGTDKDCGGESLGP